MIKDIKNKIENNERISIDEALMLFEHKELFELASLAQIVRKKKNEDKVFYNRNFHLEPTNICRFHCEFCSYRKDINSKEAYTMTFEEMDNYIKKHYKKGDTEVHLVGGVHPSYTFEKYCEIIKFVREHLPTEVKIKAFSAVEHIAVIKQANLSFEEGLKILKASGMDSITGGGAEILDDELRKTICYDKANSQEWLDFHHTAHNLGIETGSTMLYGHIETRKQRVEHMDKIRKLQDITHGFNSFIPLKYRSKNNNMSKYGECSIIEDLKTLAISRIFLDNVPHIKAYTPMYGVQTAQLALVFGADDLDGTVLDTTTIYTTAGVETISNGVDTLKNMAKEVGLRAVERDTFYNEII